VEIKNTSTKFLYRIEPKPDGGFIAQPSGDSPDGSAMETIEGATSEEVQQKIQANISELIEQQMPTLFKLGGLNITVNKEINLTTRTSSGQLVTRQENLGNGLVNAPVPIVPSSSGGTMLRVIAVLIALLLAYVFFVARR
jgi:uncharacterized membrane protein